MRNKTKNCLTKNYKDVKVVKRINGKGPLVKRFNTHAFHACIHGFESRTGHHKKKWRISSAGRASALQAEGRRFDPVILHHVPT